MSKNPSISCILEKCKFPSTCNWNKKGMQKGLEESLEAKSFKKTVVKIPKTQKIDRLKPGG